ncbi:probable BOI-related E3 ubiquitin-protein ligase 3 [Vicia villosa]|uniref:probable BOI-related E3 ubiquitin-protein ligase 3 n=1 Tax=Vicia villosa TaxID=3911 RepID=UPI00273BFD67|nr:probable BOI-related E3 ubiquitin-protein ligase 3 [Vicia villosa]
MAVEARHLHLFSPQLITNREMMNPVETNVNNIYNNMGYSYSSVPPPSSIKTAATEALILPPYNSITADSLPQKTAMNSDSGLTYNVPLRKRSRDSRDYSNSINYPFQNSYLAPSTVPQNNKSCASSSFSFLGEDISLQIQRQQLDIDQLIAQQMEKVKYEIEEKRKRQAMRLIQAIDMSVTKRLKAKEEEIEKIARTNWALEERVKSLCMENQIWRDLAQSNEATANALRSNLEQLLAQRIGNDNGDTISPVGRHVALIDDAESCCDSNESINDEENVAEWRSVGDNNNNGRNMRNCSGDGGDSGSNFVNSMKLCSNCGKDESCVLILPCRHLCLCGVCGSNLNICPICKSFKTASIHVNMS